MYFTKIDTVRLLFPGDTEYQHSTSLTYTTVLQRTVYNLLLDFVRHAHDLNYVSKTTKNVSCNII
jgi:hypothetical protein